MLTEITGTIKIVNNSNVVLEIEQNNLEEFKKYEHPTDPKKFSANFSLDNKQLWVNGVFEKKENQGDNTVIMPIFSVNKQGNGKASITVAAIKALLDLDDQKKEVKVQMLKHPRKQVEELKTKTQELQDQLDTAQQEKQDLEAEVEKLKAINSTALQQQLEEKNAKITELEALDAVALQQKLTEKENEITALKAQQNTQEVADLQQQLQAKDEEIKDLQEQLNNQPSAAQLQAKDEEITQLKAQVQQLQAKNAEVVELNKQLEESKSLVDKLQKEKQTLEDKSKTTEQPKQGNGAKYTATVGMGLAAGLIAFTALERTVRLDIWVMVGIAVASALVAGGITYAALPSTQVNGAKT